MCVKIGQGFHKHMQDKKQNSTLEQEEVIENMEKRKRTIILTRGIQGSGKTTWAKKWVSEDPDHRMKWDSDDMRNMLGPYSVPDWKTRENFINDLFKTWLRNAMSDGYDIVISNMNLSDAAVNRVKAIMDEYNKSCSAYEYVIEFKNFFIPVSECIRRDAMRSNPIGEKIIKDTWRRYRNKIIQIENNELVDKGIDFNYQQSHLVNECIIADMDSTICFNVSGREFYGKGASEKMHTDIPNFPVIDIIKRYLITAKPDDCVFIITGRTGDPDTIKATADYVKEFVSDDPRIVIFYRPVNDFSSGDTFKERIYKENIRDKYKVLYAIEDSNKCVSMYRNMGMTVLQPNAGAD